MEQVFGVLSMLLHPKKMGNFDVTLGMGWGRLAGKGDFENPMTWLSDSFLCARQCDRLGGELSTGDFFSGKEVGLFGGISYEYQGCRSPQ